MWPSLSQLSKRLPRRGSTGTAITVNTDASAPANTSTDPVTHELCVTINATISAPIKVRIGA
jgi:hypothetical protein